MLGLPAQGLWLDGLRRGNRAHTLPSDGFDLFPELKYFLLGQALLRDSMTAQHFLDGRATFQMLGRLCAGL